MSRRKVDIIPYRDFFNEDNEYFETVCFGHVKSHLEIRFSTVENVIGEITKHYSTMILPMGTTTKTTSDRQN